MQLDSGILELRADLPMQGVSLAWHLILLVTLDLATTPTQVCVEKQRNILVEHHL